MTFVCRQIWRHSVQLTVCIATSVSPTEKIYRLTHSLALPVGTAKRQTFQICDILWTGSGSYAVLETSLISSIRILVHKMCRFLFSQYPSQMWTDSNNSFSIELRNEWRKKLEWNLAPHLKSVAAIPCEIWMFNCTTVHAYCHNNLRVRC